MDEYEVAKDKCLSELKEGESVICNIKIHPDFLGTPGLIELVSVEKAKP